MNNFLLHTSQSAAETPVSNIFLDEYMPAANGAYVKIYLYLLRCIRSGQDMLSISAIADRFEHTENDVRRALAYWEKLGLLRLEYNSQQALTGICLLEPRSGKEESLREGTVPGQQTPKKPDYTADQLNSFQEQRDIRQLLFISEQYLGKTLSPLEISTILYFYDGLKFSPDLIEYLIEYCVSKNHKSLRYMETVALAWHEKGLTTVAQAKKESSLHSKSYFAVLKAFGIQGRSPVESEIGCIDRWMQDWGFSLELVLEACSRTMSAIHQPSFEYAESILKSWRDNQVKALEDVEALDARRVKKAAKPSSPGGNTSKKAGAPNRFHNFKQRDYDFSELEKKLINH